MKELKAEFTRRHKKELETCHHTLVEVKRQFVPLYIVCGTLIIFLLVSLVGNYLQHRNRKYTHIAEATLNVSTTYPHQAQEEITQFQNAGT